MEKSIPIFFGKVEKDGDYKTRILKIKEHGYDRLMSSVGRVKQNGTVGAQVKYAKKIGLKLSSLHTDYVSSELHYLWEDGKKGEQILKDLMHQLKMAHKYGFTCLVIHTEGPNSEIGLERFGRLLKLANKLNTPLAIENIGNASTFNFLFEKLGSDPMLKVCYDSGHEHCLDGQEHFLEENIDRIICLHLHDNYGHEKKDEDQRGLDRHSFIGDGTIDWDRIAKFFSTRDLSLDLELLTAYKHNYSYDELLDKGMEGANMLEEKIMAYKNKTREGK